MTIISIPRPPRRLSGALWTLERIVDPQFEPIELDDMKKHLRCFANSTDEDDEITEQFIAAREWVEDYTGRVLVDQKWRLTIDNQNGYFFANQYSTDPIYNSSAGYYPYQAIGEILLRRAPVLEITKFVSVDSLGAETAIDTDTYALCEPNSKWPRIARINGGSWLSTCFQIEFRAGFIDNSGDSPTGTVPSRFMQAIKLYAEALYDRDPATMNILIDAAKNLINSERSGLGIA